MGMWTKETFLLLALFHEPRLGLEVGEVSELIGPRAAMYIWSFFSNIN